MNVIINRPGATICTHRDYPFTMENRCPFSDRECLCCGFMLWRFPRRNGTCYNGDECIPDNDCRRNCFKFGEYGKEQPDPIPAVWPKPWYARAWNALTK